MSSSSEARPKPGGFSYVCRGCGVSPQGAGYQASVPGIGSVTFGVHPLAARRPKPGGFSYVWCFGCARARGCGVSPQGVGYQTSVPGIGSAAFGVTLVQHVAQSLAASATFGASAVRGLVAAASRRRELGTRPALLEGRLKRSRPPSCGTSRPKPGGFSYVWRFGYARARDCGVSPQGAGYQASVPGIGSVTFGGHTLAARLIQSLAASATFGGFSYVSAATR